MNQDSVEGLAILDLKDNLENQEELEVQGCLDLEAHQAVPVIQVHKVMLVVLDREARRVQTDRQDSLDRQGWMD